MPRDGAIIFGDLIDELGMQRIECAKRDPQGPLSARCPDSPKQRPRSSIILIRFDSALPKAHTTSIEAPPQSARADFRTPAFQTNWHPMRVNLLAPTLRRERVSHVYSKQFAGAAQAVRPGR